VSGPSVPVSTLTGTCGLGSGGDDSITESVSEFSAGGGGEGVTVEYSTWTLDPILGIIPILVGYDDHHDHDGNGTKYL